MRLSAELRQLCGRLAVERLRAEQWTQAAALRREMLARVQAGEDAERLAAELRHGITLASSPPRQARRAREGERTE